MTFTQQQIHALAAYVAVARRRPGHPVGRRAGAPRPAPTPRSAQSCSAPNCAQCHNFAGAGGALTYGKYAPPLTRPRRTQIYEAMLTGPEAMPVFGDTTITPARSATSSPTSPGSAREPNPGGFSLGRIGPVTEGLVAWLGGIGCPRVPGAMWITAKRRES